MPRNDSDTARLHVLAAGDFSAHLYQHAGGGLSLIRLGEATDARISAPKLYTLPASPDQRVPITLFSCDGTGFFGRPSISLSQGRKGLLHLSLVQLDQASTSTVQATYRCRLTGLDIATSLKLTPYGILLVKAKLINTSDKALTVHHAATLTMEIPEPLSHILHAEGMWTTESHETLIPIKKAVYEKTACGGRTGFNGAGFLTLVAKHTTHDNGPALCAAVHWSGNSCMMVEGLGDGRRQMQAGLLLDPGEGYLEPGEAIDLPAVSIAFTDKGLNQVSQQFHRIARSLSPKADPRHCQLNSWEAVYFDMDEKTVMELITAAADLGLERFVLDDGWFQGRRDDTSSLGDWVVDKDLFPNGLRPVIDHAKSLGLQFGLWLEPEMISENSDLYRSNPDWVLSVEGYPMPTGRCQWVLDLTNANVTNYLFDTVNSLLTDNDIAYIKWDHNRALYPAANGNGQVARNQTEALYHLLGRIRKAHPDVLIEACASGSGRLDYGMLPYVTRYWASDATDPVERLRIQRVASRFFPPEMLGCHIGPSPNPITGRETPLMFRAIVAFFGHLGLEADPRKLAADEKDLLCRVFIAYKTARQHMVGANYAILHQSDELLVDQFTSENGTVTRIISLTKQKTQLPFSIQGIELLCSNELSTKVMDSSVSINATDTLTGAVYLSDMKGKS